MYTEQAYVRCHECVIQRKFTLDNIVPVGTWQRDIFQDPVVTGQCSLNAYCSVSCMCMLYVCMWTIMANYELQSWLISPSSSYHDSDEGGNK